MLMLQARSRRDACSPVLLVVLAVALVMPILRAQHLDFDADIADWHLFDATGDGRDDLLVILGADGGAHGAVFLIQGEDGSFERRIPIELPRDAVAISLGSFTRSRGSDLALLGPDGASLLTIDGDGKITRRDLIVKTPLLFRAPSNGPPAFFLWPTDVDADGSDDLVLPVDDGVTIWFGDEKGGFEEPAHVELPLEGVAESAGDALATFVRSYPRPVFENLIGDAALEVAWFDDRGLGWFEHDGPRRFAATPGRYELAWLSDAKSSGILEQTDVSLANVLSADRCDLVLGKMRTEEGRIFDMTSTLVVLESRTSGAPYSKSPSFAQKANGVIGYGPKFADVDRDGRLDLVMGTYAGGITDAVARLFKNVPVTLNVHLGTKGAKSPFSPSPDFTMRLSVPLDDFERWGARGAIAAHEDLTGDGIADLLHIDEIDGVRQARVMAGVKDAKGFRFESRPKSTRSLPDLVDFSLRRLVDGGTTVIILERERRLEFWRP